MRTPAGSERARRRIARAMAVAVAAGLASAIAVGTSAAAPELSRAAPPAESCPSSPPTGAPQLRRDIRFMAARARGGRAPGSAGDRQTRRFLVERFRCLGLEPGGRGGGFQARFTTSEGDRTANVIGLLRGGGPRADDQAIVVGAHHDHIGRRGKDGRRIYRGANDNASGTAGMLALAAGLAGRERPPRRTIVFAAFGAEETVRSAPYLEGSVRFVLNPPPGIKARDIAFMFNLDMIGSYNARRAAHVYAARRKAPVYRTVKRLAPRQLSLRFRGRPPLGDSDFWPFARRGIPFAYFHTPDPRCWHSLCDVPRRIDHRPMAALVKLAARTTAELADRRKRPR